MAGTSWELGDFLLLQSLGAAVLLTRRGLLPVPLTAPVLFNSSME